MSPTVDAPPEILCNMERSTQPFAALTVDVADSHPIVNIVSEPTCGDDRELVGTTWLLDLTQIGL